MRFILAILLILQICTPTWAQTVSKNIEFNSVNGVDYSTNLVKNPSAYKNTNDISASCTVTQDTSSTYYFNSKASYSYSCTSGQYIEFTLNTPSVEQTQGNCEFKGKFQASAAGMEARVLDGSSNVLTSAVLTSESSYRDFSVNYPCGASGARKVRLHNGTGSTITGHAGKIYYGSATNISTGVPNNVFSAKISDTGVVTAENQDFINGNCSMGGTNSATATCTFNSGLFTATPNCSISPALAAINYAAQFTGSNSSSQVVFFGQALSGTPTAIAINLICTRSGSDFIQPTITSPQWDYDWTSYTQTITGSTSNPVKGTSTESAMQRRVNDTMEINYSYYQTAAGTAGSGTYLFTVPNGQTIDTTKQAISSGSATGLYIVGHGSAYNGTTQYSLECYAYSSTQIACTSYAEGTGTANDLGSANVSFGNTAARISFNVKIPIAGWTTSQKAPQLTGSVTSNATTSALKFEAAQISASAIVTSSTSSWATWVKNSAGNYTGTFTPAFSSTPFCVTSGNNGSTTIALTSVHTISSTAVTILVNQNSFTSQSDNGFQIFCMGAR